MSLINKVEERGKEEVQGNRRDFKSKLVSAFNSAGGNHPSLVLGQGSILVSQQLGSAKLLTSNSDCDGPMRKENRSACPNVA